MTRRKSDSLLAACALVAASLFLAAPTAHAVHALGLFELEGNVADDSGAPPPDDWARVFNAPNTLGPKHLQNTGIRADPAPQTIFAGGGSKDDLDLNGPLSKAGGWKHKSGSVPDKDDITNAFAAAYSDDNDLIVYAGIDRFATSGDAHVGFWFFQGAVSPNFESGKFNGQHAVGDVLVLANFTGGGDNVFIQVLRWVGAGGNVNNTLQTVVSGAAARCTDLVPGDLFCGRTNKGVVPAETPPWPYQNKSGTSVYPSAGFFEIGINLTKVFQQFGGGEVPCISSFLAETRSSSSPDAVLKDFVSGGFPVCGIAVSKVCKNPVLASSTQIRYTIEGRVQNTGFGQLSNVSLSDNPPVSNGFSFFGCNANDLPDDNNPINFDGVLNALASVCYRAAFLSTTQGPSDTITATGSTGPATVSATATANCPDLPLSPNIDVTKQCTTTLAQVSPYLVVKVNVSGTVKNIGNSPLSNVTVTDTDVTGNLLGSPISLAPDEEANFTASYFPASAENRRVQGTDTLVPGLAIFRDTVTATGTGVFDSGTVMDMATANCTLCPTCSPDICSDTECPQSTGASSSSLFR